MADVANITEVTATGDVTTETGQLYAVTLTAAAAAATVQIKAGGSGGTSVLRLEAAANSSTAAPLNAAVRVSGGIHVTLSGSGAVATVVHS